MEQVVIAIHVLAAVLLIGPVAIATSAYAPALRKAQGGDEQAVGSLQTIAKLSHRYGIISLLVPLLGLLAFFTVDGAMKNGAIHAAIAISIIAWALLVFGVLPKQRLGLISADALEPGAEPASEKEQEKLRSTDASSIPGSAAMLGGIFNLLWIIAAILMFV